MTEANKPEPIRVRTFEELRAALATRRKELGMSQMVADDVSGLQGGYVAKLECGIKRPGDMSLPTWLDTLGIELAIMPAASRHKNKSDVSERYATKRKEIASMGGKARGAKLSRELRRKSARDAANVRWERERREKARAAAAEKRRALAAKRKAAPKHSGAASDVSGEN